MSADTQVQCDVLIVGGGPAGSSCGWKLMQSGMNVLIMDKATFPRDKVCAGWITPPIIQELELDLEAYAKENILQPIRGFRTGILGGKLLETRYDEPVSYAIRRCEFDTYLLRRSGVPTHLGESFRSAERMHDGWLVNHFIQARMLIGAGGHFCPVARLLNSDTENPRDLIAAQEVEYELKPAEAEKCTIQPDIPELYFYPDLKGYAWCVRKGSYINIGLGRDHEQKLTGYRDEFLRFLQSSGRIPSLPSENFHGHAYRIYRRPQRRVVDHQLLLIGDSAGLAVPQSGEGIRPAIESGLFAADVILSAQPSFDRDQLAAYETRLATQYGEPVKPYHSGTGLLSRLRLAAAHRLLRSRWFTRNILIDRWFLQRHLAGIPSSESIGAS